MKVKINSLPVLIRGRCTCVCRGVVDTWVQITDHVFVEGTLLRFSEKYKDIGDTLFGFIHCKIFLAGFFFS